MVHAISVWMSGFHYRRICFEMVFYTQQNETGLADRHQFWALNSVPFRNGLLWVFADSDCADDSSCFQADWGEKSLTKSWRKIYQLSFQGSFRDSQNPAAVYMLRACQCCLACFENFLQFLGRNAYIIVSMDGSSFCIGGKRAFHILSTNSLRVFAINSVGDFVLFLGKVFVVIATVLIGIEMIQVNTLKCSFILLHNFDFF